MTPPSRLVRGAPVAALLSLAACGGDGGTAPPRLTPGLRVVSGGGGEDTTLATRSEPLVVEVVDSAGRPAVGAQVTFQTWSVGGELARRGLMLCETASTPCTSFDGMQGGFRHVAYVAADAAGRAQVRLQHGIAAGPTHLTVRVPSLGYAEDVAFVTRPGSAVRVRAATRDTAVSTGKSFPLAARVVDRFDNARDDAVVVTPADPSVANVADGVVRGVTPGRTRIALRAGPLADSVLVSVAPPGRLLAGGPAGDAAGLAQLVLLDTDGSARRRVATTAALGPGLFPYPAWNHDGSRILHSTDGQRLSVRDTIGSAAALLLPAFTTSGWPTFARGAGAMFFYGAHPSLGRGVFRANADGSDPRLVATDGGAASPSPDGARFVYPRLTQTSTIAIREVATGQVTTLAAQAGSPRWSPTGEWIAIVTNDPTGAVYALDVVRPDGTGRRTVATGRYSVGGWSPDGQWIVTVRQAGGVDLVRVSDGLLVPIPHTHDYYQLDWRP